jgi:hypothetical protein
LTKDLSIYGEDINHPSSLVMSGVESDTYWDIAIGEGIDRLLVSYHYIQRKGKKFLRSRLEKHPNVKIMIDSGAYTFHVKEEEYKQKPLEFWEKYLEKYTNFIKDNKDIIFSCVELDIANIVGFDKVDYFRKKYFEPLRDEGVLVCYVWHDYDGEKYWEEMCKKYDYVGFSLAEKSMSEANIVKKVNTAKRYGSLIHGFGVTRVELMSKVPFFTGDSTTWLVGTQYGELNWFDGRKMKRLKKDKWKKDYKQKYIKLGANWDLAGKENPYELIRINLIVFKQAEEYIRKRIKGKSYWLSKSLLVGGEEKPMTKKLIRRKKKNEGEKAQETINPVDSTNSSEPVQTTRGDGEGVEDRPKTKFEEFKALSESKEKEIKDLDEQIEKLPSIEWFDGDSEDYKDFYRDLGLSFDSYEKEEVLDILFNFCIFLKDTDELEEQEDEQLISLVKFLVKRDVESREEAIEELTDFYSKNLTGEREDFKIDDSMMMGEAPPRPKEREEYLQDDDYDLVDIPEEEMSNYLPAPSEESEMPEVDELDKELNKKGVVAVRDEKGRFLKGQKKVRKPKQLYSKHFPKLACNTCYKAGECPEYKPDHACAYDSIFKKFKTRNVEDLIDAMHGMADLNMERMQRLMLFETMDGGMADPTLTSMIDQNLNIMMKMKQLHEQKAQIIATQRRTQYADGRTEEETSVTNPSGGILSKIFGGDTETDKERKEIKDDDIIDAKE